MRSLTIALLVLFCMAVASTASGQLILRPPPASPLACELWGHCVPRILRLIPPDPSPYIVPRSVGAWSQYNDMSSLPPKRPFQETLQLARDVHGLTAVGFHLGAHPTDSNEAYNECGEYLPESSMNAEKIRKAFREPGIDIIVLWMSYFAVIGDSCDGYKFYEWQNYSTGEDWRLEDSLFDQFYQFYANQPKAIVIMSYEGSARLHGGGCMERDECVPISGSIDGCLAACAEDPTYGDDRWHPEGYVRPLDCQSVCCDLAKLDRRQLMLRKFNARQAAAERARAAHPDAALRVFHAVEIDRFGVQDEWLLTARDVIPFMDSRPDFVGLSLWPAKGGDVVESFNRVRSWTSLPGYRLFIAEVGAREKIPGDQYARIMEVVPPLFDLGSPFALVWSLEQSDPEYQTLHALVDPATGEYRSGMAAIEELNATYR